MIEWNIQTRAHACQGCHHPFADQEVYHTLLFDEPAGYQRLDICRTCWTGPQGQANSRPGCVSHWQGTYEAPSPQPELIRKETAETLLRKLVERNDPRHLAAQYIVAVMLERKRLIKVKDQVQREGRRVFIYEQPRSGDVFTIIDPGLNLDQLEAVQRDVAQLLEQGLEAPPAPALAPEPAVVAEAPASVTPPAGEPGTDRPGTAPAV